MIYNLKYYFKLLFHHTRYLEVCAIMIIISFAYTTMMFSVFSDVIMAEEFPCADMFPFFINIGPYAFSYSSFMLLVPLLVPLPVGQILSIEKKNKSMILSRTNKLTNYLSKLFISFFVGFSLMMIALGCSILFSQIILHSDIQNIHYFSSGFSPSDTDLTISYLGLYNLYLTEPFLVSIINMFMLSVLGGALSSLSLLVENFYHNKILIYCVPFIFMIINEILGGIIPMLSDLLYISPRYSDFLIYLLIYLIVFIIFTTLSSLYYYKKDCY